MARAAHAANGTIASTIVNTVNSIGCGTPVRTHAAPITEPLTIAAATGRFTIARMAEAKARGTNQAPSRSTGNSAINACAEPGLHASA
jgi:hypothetical protein